MFAVCFNIWKNLDMPFDNHGSQNMYKTQILMCYNISPYVYKGWAGSWV